MTGVQTCALPISILFPSHDISLRYKVLSIEQVECLFDSENSKAVVDNISYTGYQDGIVVTVWKSAFGHGVSFKLISLQVTHLEEGMGGGCPFPVDTSDEEDQGEIVF